MILFDQWTKYLAVTRLRGKEPFVLLENILELTYVENRGAAFGMMKERYALFFVIAAVVCTLLFLLSLKVPEERRYLPIRFSFVLIIAGALGNLIDRMLHRYVVDFIYFKPIDFPVFNVADIYITCSCAVLVLLMLFYYREDELDFLNLRTPKSSDRTAS